MEIGITAMNPDTIDFPSCAQKLTNGTWVNLCFLYANETCLQRIIKLLPFYADLVWH